MKSREKIHQYTKSRQFEADISAYEIYIIFFLIRTSVATHMHGPIDIHRTEVCVQMFMHMI